jgi:YggT family protein
MITLIHLLSTLYTIVIIARGLLPLLGMSFAHPVMRFVYNATEPLLAPIRQRLPPTGMLDLSPMVLILIVWLVEQIMTWTLLALIG